MAVDVEGIALAIRVHTDDVQDRDGAPDVILTTLEKALTVTSLRADGGYQGPKRAGRLTEPEWDGLFEIVEKPRDFRSFTVLCRPRVVERTIAWLP